MTQIFVSLDTLYYLEYLLERGFQRFDSMRPTFGKQIEKFL